MFCSYNVSVETHPFLFPETKNMTSPNNPHYVAGLQEIINAFKQLDDPRMVNKNDHRLIDIIVIAVCAVIAGADGPTAIGQWAKIHQDNLKRYLKLPNGIPSHDTFGRILKRIQPAAFQKCFVEWIESLRDKNGELREHIAIDGKEIRGSRKNNLGALHIVSAWSTENGIALGQIAAEEKSNEITAIPELLDQIDVSGCVVTIDAIATQKKIVQKIINKNADYVIAVKGNQQKLYDAVQSLFESTDLNGRKVSRWMEDEKSHGRMEHREYYQMLVGRNFPLRDQWTGLKSVILAVRTHVDKTGKSVAEKRFFISSLGRDGRAAARYVRKHWGIENSLHWILDMTFREDESQIEDRILGENLSWIRRFTVTLARAHPAKNSIAGKRRAAAWSFDFLMQLLQCAGK